MGRSDEGRDQILHESIYSKYGVYVCCNTRDLMYDQLHMEVEGYIKDRLSAMSEEELASFGGSCMGWIT